MTTVKAVLFRPGAKTPKWLDFRTAEADGTDLEELRRHIGCEWIEAVSIRGTDLTLWCDEEGMANYDASQTNSLLLPRWRLRGNALLTRCNMDNEGAIEADVTAEDLEALKLAAAE